MGHSWSLASCPANFQLKDRDMNIEQLKKTLYFSCVWADRATPPIAEILCVKNRRVLNEIILKRYAESLKQIVGAVWELTWVEMGWIGCAF